ncbi:MAG TPA: hypothetical protein VHT26_16505, partial [Trebonia sp.]|nr:hypothetical protein [Trebonia sp.]
RRRRDGAAHHPVPRGGGAASHNIAMMHEGRIVAEGTADQLKSAVGATSLDEVFLALTAAHDTDDLATVHAPEVTR